MSYQSCTLVVLLVHLDTDVSCFRLATNPQPKHETLAVTRELTNDSDVNT